MKISLINAVEVKNTPAQRCAINKILEDGLPLSIKTLKAFVPTNLVKTITSVRHIILTDPVILFSEGGGEDQYRGWFLMEWLAEVLGELMHITYAINYVSEEEAQEWVHTQNALIRVRTNDI